MKISVFGSGYVGLVTAACLADVGHQVLCMDVDAEKVTQLTHGAVPIYEPGLSELVQRNHEAGRLRFTTDAEVAVAFGVLQFIAVGTPPDEDGSADLQYVLAVARTIGRYMHDEKVVVTKSTVPVGTACRVHEAVAQALAQRGVSVPFEVCSNPEFLKEGSAIEDFNHAARIVVGTDSQWVRVLMRECYAPYIRLQEKLVFMGGARQS